MPATSPSIGSLSSTACMSKGGFDVVIGNPPYVEYLSKFVANVHCSGDTRPNLLRQRTSMPIVMERGLQLTLANKRSIPEL